MGSILGITLGELATTVVPATLADVHEDIALSLRLSLSPVISLEVAVQNVSEVSPLLSLSSSMRISCGSLPSVRWKVDCLTSPLSAHGCVSPPGTSSRPSSAISPSSFSVGFAGSIRGWGSTAELCSLTDLSVASSWTLRSPPSLYGFVRI
jgi:hypothetical protein